MRNNGEIVALIPARSGSKGLPGKNTRLLGGLPLIAYSILAARACPEIRRTIVSTDSDAIAEIARSFGAEVPFLRPAELAQDDSSDLDVIRHFLDWLHACEGRFPELLVHLRPTTPLRIPEDLQAALERARSVPEATALRSVHRMSESAYKCVELGADGFLRAVYSKLPELDASNAPRQTFPATYVANGYVDVLKPKLIRSSGRLHGNRVLAFETAPTPEIDSALELEHSEWMLSRDARFAFYLRKGAVR